VFRIAVAAMLGAATAVQPLLDSPGQMSLTVELQAPQHGLSQPEGLDYGAPRLRSPGTALAILAAKSPEETARFLAVAVSVQMPRLALRGELSAASPTTVTGDEEQGGAG